MIGWFSDLFPGPFIAFSALDDNVLFTTEGILSCDCKFSLQSNQVIRQRGFYLDRSFGLSGLIIGNSSLSVRPPPQTICIFSRQMFYVALYFSAIFFTRILWIRELISIFI